MRTKLAGMIVVCCLIVAPNLSAVGTDETWAALRHITRARRYRLTSRDSKCYEGEILSVGAQSITLRLRDLTTVTIGRIEVLRFGEGINIRDTAYSGRSSWLDVTEIPIDTKQHTRILMKNGKKHDGRKVGYTDSEITLLEHGKLVAVAKNEISKVYFDRLRPLSENDEYLLDELAYLIVLDPKFWEIEADAGPKIPLLLYDAATPENNAAPQCEGRKYN